MKNVALYVAIALVAAACASNEKKDVPVTDSGKKPPTQGDTRKPDGNDTRRLSQDSIDPTKDPKNVLSKRSIYFDYDSNVVKDEYKNLVQSHARFLADNKSRHVRIEGNCDERGSREYNLALGQRRAEAVKKVMTVLGVQDGRIETVSFGEEKPKNPGHDEAAWAENRRADIRYAGE